MFFIRKIIRNSFLNVLILFGLAFNVANLDAFSAKSLIEEPQNAFKSFVENFKTDPVGFTVIATIITVVAAVSVGFVVLELNNSQVKKDAYDKKLKETCVVCDKLNNECECDLLEKLNHVFTMNGFIETREYLDGSFYQRYCNWLTKEIKSVILKINDINMKFNYEGDNETTILHIACDYGHEPIIRWLVEDMFVNISAFNSKGFTASSILKKTQSFYASRVGIISEKFTSAYDFFSKINECFLDEKAKLQNELFDYVKSVKDLLQDNRSQEDLVLVWPDVKLRLEKIRGLMLSKKTPGFAKQLVMSDLIFIHQNYKDFISKKVVIDFYKHIAFNYAFLTDGRFVRALEFAESHCDKEINDIYGRTVAQAREVYKEDGKGVRCEQVEDFVEVDYFSSVNLGH